MAGLYIHIPFCKSRCIYCGFYSTTLLGRRQAYTDALCEEMRLREKPELGTIYIGGGTPSQLDHNQLSQLFAAIRRYYPILDDAEITVECNPDDITPALAEQFVALGVNRVSMGVQTFDDQRLQFLRRRHTSLQAGQAVRMLRQAGLKDISIDLMFAFPGQTLAEWEDDIRQALSLKVEHLSSYSLTIEEGTPLWQMSKAGQLKETDEDLYVSMYEALIRHTTQAGYEHYEISNFALPGFRSRHNSNYWSGVPYVGIGAAAHSYDILTRQWNISDINAYIAAIGRGQIPSESEELDLQERYNDLVTTALRTSKGISLEKVRADYGVKISQHLIRQAARWQKSGHLHIDNDHISLTLSGIMVSDMVMSDLIWV